MLAPAARVSTRRCARVIMYHRFGIGDAGTGLDVGLLEEQLAFMRRHFNVVHLGDIVSRLRSGTEPDPYTVAVTVDDAYADFGELAYPVFRRHGVPVTLYVVSEFAGGKIWLWWDAIRHVLTHARDGRYRVATARGLTTVRLSDTADREAAWHALADAGLALSPDERDRYVRDLEETFSVPLPDSPTEDCAALDWDAVRALDPELVEIGSHTCTHPILSRCDAARLAREIAESKSVIEERLGRRVKSFCYPNGQWTDVDERCFAVVRDAGYESAVMACGTLVCVGDDRYALNRIPVSDRWDDFMSDMSGVSHVRRRITDRIDR